MRRLPTEVKSQGERGAAGLGMRGTPAAKRSRLRRLTMESLEERALMASTVLSPVPVVSNWTPITTNPSGNPPALSPADDSSPFIAVDPLNSKYMVTVFTDTNTNRTNNLQQSGMEYSTNGGTTWTASGLLGGTSGDPSSTTGLPYSVDQAMGVDFDRSGNFYVGRLESDGTNAGEVLVYKFTFTSAAGPKAVNGNSGTHSVVYQWNRSTATSESPNPWTNQPAIMNFSMAVDSNYGSYTDPATGTTQSDASTGNVYIAWTAQRPVPSGFTGTWNPYTIEMVGSVDGVTWASYLPSVGATDNATTISGGNFGNNSQYTAPELAISQGSPATAAIPAVNDVQTLSITGNPTSGNVAFDVGNFGINVTISLGETAAAVQTNLNTILDAAFGAPAGITLIDVTGGPFSATAPLTFTATNLLTSEIGGPIPTSTIASSTLNNGATGVVTHTTLGAAAIPATNGVTGGQITAIFDDFNLGSINGANVDYIDSNSMTYAGGAFVLNGVEQVATTKVRGALAVPVSGLAPGAQIASNNTLGSFSENEGALYVVYVGANLAAVTPLNDTGIYLVKSTDGGQTWSNPLQTTTGFVNDDLGTTDGFSGATIAGSDRPKYEPAIAVDNVTGTVAVSWLDTRDDPTTSRYADYIATSIDGGQTFSTNTFANAPNDPTDAITGNKVTVGPESDASVGALGFGSHQALAIVNGVVYPVWSGTMVKVSGQLLSDGYDGEGMGIDIAQATYATGPRVISATMGPVTSTTVAGSTGSVTFNNTQAANGSQEINGFSVTFNQPVLISSFTTAEVTVTYQNPYTGADTTIPVASVQALDAKQSFVGNANATTMATEFFVSFVSAQSAVGTYSYTVGPNITNQARTATQVVTAATTTFSAPQQLAISGGVPTSGTVQLTYTNPSNNNTLTVTVPYDETAAGLQVLINPLFGTALVNGVTIDNVVVGGGALPGTALTLTVSPTGTLADFVLALPTVGASTLNNGAVLTPSLVALPVTINDAPQPSLTPTVSTINVNGITGTQTVNGVSVTINSLLYAPDNQLVISLIAPNGATLLLSNGNGGGGANYTGTVFSAAGTTAIAAGTAPFTGTYSPDGSIAAFLALMTLGGGNGGWQLQVKDTSTGLLTFGSIASWSLSLTELTSSGATTAATTFNSTAAVAINGLPNNPATSTVTVSGITANQTVTKVTVDLQSITYPTDGDLYITITSPTGVTTVLSNLRGGSGANFTGTIFDSTAANPIGSVGNSPPYSSGPYTPDGTNYLGVPGPGLGQYNGFSTTLNGTWTLKVYDELGDGIAATGTVNSWSLSVSTEGYTANTTSPGNKMDQNTNGTAYYSAPGQTATGLDTTTLPMIIPGPHVVSTSATYTASINQVLAISGGIPTSGSVTVLFTGLAAGDTAESVSVPYNETAAGLQALVDPIFGAGNVVVTGGPLPTSPLTITPSTTGAYPGQAIPTLTLGASTLNNSAVMTVGPTSQSYQSTSSDDLALNGTVSALVVTFDRDINAGTFTTSQIISMLGPVGQITGPFTVTTVAGTLRSFSIGFPAQQLSGTYSLVLGSGIESAPELSITGTPTSGVVNLTFTNPVTSATLTVAVPYNATAAQVQALINPLFGAGNVVVGGGALPGTALTFTSAGSFVGHAIAAPTIASSTLNAGAVATVLGGDLMDNNENAGVTRLFGDSTTGATTNVTHSTDKTKTYAPDVPLTPANNAIVSGTITTSTITVNDSFNISATQLSLDITYPQDSDLTATLTFTPSNLAISPITVPLFTNIGGALANFSGTTFTDAVTATPIASGVAPFSGLYNPQSPLAAFNGLLAQGTFTLSISNGASANVGTLNAFSLTLSKAANVTIPAGTAAVPPTVPATYTPTTTTSVITVNDNVAIQALKVTLNIVHPHDPDLTATLSFTPTGASAPAATVTLFSGVGNTGPLATQQNFTNTSFSDAATNTPIQNGSAPFTGLFNPASPFTPFVGLEANGVFTLTITNNGPDAGVLTSFSVTLTELSSSGLNSGLGEPVADQTSASFRIFTMAPTDPVASNTWTPVGGASNNGGANSGRIGGIAVDPSDPSGNTVYVAGASGGVWKTTDFLTTNPNGPTYIPLTDAAATNGINIGSIAVFGRNNNPNQSIVIVGTGEGDTNSPGVGFLISYNGGATWTLDDSLNNYTAAGVEIPSSQRDHTFVGLSTYKVIVDPHPSPNGDVIIYAAMTGPNGLGGVYRSLDSGRNWTQMLSGALGATDIAFDPNSGVVDAFSNPTGNLRTIYAALYGQGVYVSPNQGQLWNPMTGGVGDPLIQNFNPTTGKFVPVPVAAPAGTPNGSVGRIELAHPDLTGNADEDVLYEGWLYALVATPDGHLDGLFMTKDGGQNWVKIALPNAGPITNGVTTGLVPSNDTTNASYDIFGGQGNYDMSIVVDPNNPNIVYIGGTSDYGPAAMIRVDVTGLADAHSLYSSPTTNSAGVLQNTTNPISIFNPAKILALPAADGYPDPLTNPYLNLVPNYGDPFTSDATVDVIDSGTLSNSGSGATYTPFITILDGTTDIHRMIAMVDPTTGKTRLLIGDDQGIFSGVVDGSGNLITSIGTETLPGYARNGNIQITQFYGGAAQPSTLAAQIAGAMFYGEAQDDGSPQSDPNVLSNGNIIWTGPTGDGTLVATDATGSGTEYQYLWPCCGGGTDFFMVNGVGRTNGLIQTTGGAAPPLGGPSDPQWPSVAGFNFAVNPVNPDAIMQGSAAGRLFGTENQGLNWYVLANPTTFDSTVINALAYGAPDPNGPGVPGALDNYMIVGTNGGHIYVSFTGGASIGSTSAWINISNGLDGSSVQQIVTDPNRGSHDAYAVTTTGVFYNANTAAANSTWVNITGNLFKQMFNPFGDANLTQVQLNSLLTVTADWRYVVPFNPANPTGPTHPMLYVAGDGGVFRSTDNGTTWTLFPALYQSPATAALNLTTTAGGDLPVTKVTDLSLSLGDVNPTTGRPQDGPTSPNVLLATTYGNSSYAIRLAPVVFNDAFNKVALTTGSDTGKYNNDGITNDVTPIFTGLSEQSAYGNQVAITLEDVTNPKAPIFLGGYNPSKPTTDATFTLVANQTNSFGDFSVQVNAGAYDAVNHTTDGVRTVAIFATDAAGTQGNPVYFTFTLLTKLPATPGAPVLEPASDSSHGFDYTNINDPIFDVTPTVDNSIVLLFRKQASAPDSSYVEVASAGVPIGYTTVPVTGTSVGITSGSMTVTGIGTSFNKQLSVGQELIFAADPTKTVYTIASIASATSLKLTTNYAGVTNLTTTAGLINTAIQDPGPVPDGQYTYMAEIEDLAGNISLPSPDSKVITIDTIAPLAPSAPILQAASDSSHGLDITNVTDPTFTVNTAEAAPTSTELLRGTLANGSNATVVATVTAAGLIQSIQDPGPVPQGTYYYFAEQIDRAGNVGPLSPGTKVQILTTIPGAAPTLALLPSDDSGVKGDDKTNVTQPHLFGIAPVPIPPGYSIDLVLVVSPGVDETLTTIVDPNNGNYIVQFPTPLNGSGPNGQNYTVFVQVRDVANNTLPSKLLTLTIKTTAPTTAPTLSILSTDAPPAQPVLGTSVGVTSGSATVTGVGTFFNTQLVVGDQLTFALDPTKTVYQVASITSATSLVLTTPYAGTTSAATGALVLSTATTVRRPHLVGVTDPGNVVVVTDANNDVLATTTASTFAQNGHPAGYYSLQLAANLADGAIPLYVVATDVEGNSTPKPTLPSLNLVIYSNPGDYNGDGKSDLAVYRWDPTVTASGTWFIRPSGGLPYQVPFGEAGVDIPVPGDYTGTGQTIPAVFRPTTDTWYISPPVTSAIVQGTSVGVTLGSTLVTGVGTFFNTQLVVGDRLTFTSDATEGIYVVASINSATSLTLASKFAGATNAATSATNIGLPSPATIVQLGTVGQSIPVPGTYDTTGRTEVATYNPATQTWNVLLNLSTPLNPSSKITATFGFAKTDYPVPGDYLNLGYDELAVYRPLTGQWYARNPTTNQAVLVTGTAVIGGKTGDIPIPGDYDGIGYTEAAVYRPSTGQFIIYNPVTKATETRTLTYPVGFSFQAGDIPVPEDYDGDGKVDLAVYRPSTAYYFINYSSTGQAVFSSMGYVGHDIPPQAPLSYLVSTIDGSAANIPDLITVTPSIKTAILIAGSTTVSPTPITTPAAPAAPTTSTIKPALITKTVIPQSVTPKPTLTVGKSRTKVKTPARPKLVVSHSHAANVVKTGPQTVADAAIESLSNSFKGLFGN